MLKYFVFLVSLTLFSEHVVFKGVKMPSYSEAGLLESIIKCQKAIQKDSFVDMSGVELEVFDEQQTKINTAKCKYLQYEKLISGSDKIYMKSSKMDLSGLGFEYDLTKKELTIQKDVLIYLNETEGEKK